MTEQEEKTLKEYTSNVLTDVAVYEVCVFDVAKAIQSALKTIEEQKQWMARFVSDSGAYKQGQRDEIRFVIDWLADKAKEMNKLMKEDKGPQENGYAYGVIMENVELCKLLVERRSK